MEVGNGGRCEPRPLSSLVDALGLAALEVAHKLGQGGLGFAKEDVIGLRYSLHTG